MTTHASDPPPADRYFAYTSAVEKLCRGNPGARGALRNGLRRDLDHPRVQPMHKWLHTRIPEDTSPPDRRAYYTVAALIAAQPRHTFTGQEPEPEPEPESDAEPGAEQGVQKTAGAQKAPAAKADRGGSFGMTLGRAAVAGALRYSAAENRITLLSKQSIRGIHLHLPSAVHQVRADDITVDWARLLGDLISWRYRSGRVVRLWLQDFYRVTADLAQD